MTVDPLADMVRRIAAGATPTTWCRVFAVGPPCAHPCDECLATARYITSVHRESSATPPRGGSPGRSTPPERPGIDPERTEATP